jgi:co-chaperonin GroES (HSP10)
VIRNERDKLQKAVDDMYAKAKVRTRPNYPFVLVRVLNREQKQGLIILPEKQKKTTIEGIVLDVFAPFFKSVGKRTSSGTVQETHEVEVAASVKPGDHVLFQHFEGVPVPTDDYYGDYRLVPEVFGHYGAERNGIIAVLEYEQTPVAERLCAYVPDDTTIRRLMDEFEIIPRNQTSKTQSAYGKE